MTENIHIKKSFTNANYAAQTLSRNEFDGCVFKNCDFTSAILISIDFTDCIFDNCNLSNVKLNQVILKNVKFKDSKLMGIGFGHAKDFGFELHFEDCNLSYTSFDKKNFNKSSFKNCKITGANFTQTNLSKTKFESCDFQDSNFANSNLNGVDLTTCSNFMIDPEMNTIKKAKFSYHNVSGLLFRHDIIIE